MKAQQLKNSILQLAIQGKLVPQDPNDEPASVLLERIRAEKQRLIKVGKIKKDKNESVIYRAPKSGSDTDNLPYAFFERTADDTVRDITDKLPFDVPESWEWVRLGSIISVSSGKGLTTAQMTTSGSIPVYGGNGITGYHDKSNVTEKTLVIGRVGFYCGATHITEEAAWVTDNALIVFFTQSVINIYWLRLLIDYAELRKSSSSTAQPLVSGKIIYPLFVPLPPLAEQHRIVERIEQLLPYITAYDTAEQKLTALNAAFPDALKKSILQAAVQGKLVPQDPTDEPASVLLERIRAEKAALVKAGKIKHDSVIFRRGNSHYEKQSGVERCIDDEIPFDVPESWECVRLGDIFHIIMGQSPDGKSVSETDTGIEFHQGKVFFSDYIITRSNQSTSEPTKIAPANSVLLCVRAPVGKVNITDRELCIGRGLCAVQPLAEMTVNFAFRLLESYENIFVKQATGTTFIAITGEIVKNQLVPLPPLAEQHRIVERIDMLTPMLTML